MTSNKIKQISAIENLGLSKNEASVYLAGLNLGPATVVNISTVSGLERTNIYRIIKSLERKGLFSTEVMGIKKLYRAESPERLEQVLESKRENFKKILPELKDIYGKSISSGGIKYFSGIEGIKTVYARLIEEQKMSDFYYVISNLEQWHSIDPKYFNEFIKKRINRNLQIKLLVQDGEKAKYNKKYENNFLQKVKILSKDTLLDTDTIVTPNKVVIIQLDEPITIFVIENKSLIQAHKQYFEIMWNSIPE